MDTLNILVVLLLALALGLSAVVITWLMGRYRALQAAHSSLVQTLDQISSELNGLCAANLKVDGALIAYERQLQELLVQAQAAQIARDRVCYTTYDGAIDRVRQGAKPTELVAEFGMGASEAELLVRLHAGKV